jgi:hypothetical protein
MSTVQVFRAGAGLQAHNLQVYENILQTTGRNPLVKLKKVTAGTCRCTVLGKVEFFNPGGSVKDRIGVSIIEDAERPGLLKLWNAAWWRLWLTTRCR